MHRLTRGMAWVAAVGLVAACSGDPTADLRGNPELLSIQPGSVTLVQGDSINVEVQVLDGQGNPLAIGADVTIGSTPSGVTATRVTDLTPVYDENGDLVTPEELPRAVINVRATTLLNDSFPVTVQGLTQYIRVKSVPAALTGATFSNATPIVNETVTLTMPGNFRLLPDATIETNQGEVLNLAIADGGGSATFIPVPGSLGPVSIVGAEPTYAPGLSLTLATDVNLDVQPIGPYEPNTGDPTAAGVIPTPATGETISFYDQPTFTAADAGIFGQDHFYRFTVAATDTFNFTLDWADHDGDLDFIIVDEAITTIVDASMATGNAPEAGTIILDPGTYILVVDLYAGSAGGWMQMTIENPAAAAPAPALAPRPFSPRHRLK